jgi:hypothetical protein
MPRKQTNTRQLVELDKKRIPLRKLLNGKEIREAAKALEDFRLIFNEQEILYGAKLYVKMDTYGEALLIARRLETDKEYNDRLERARIAAEKKRELEQKRKEAEAERILRAESEKKQKALDSIAHIAKTTGLSGAELEVFLKSFQN